MASAFCKGFLCVLLGAHASCVRGVRSGEHTGSVRSQGRPAPVSAVRFLAAAWLRCVLRARQEIRCAFWRERRAGRSKAPRRRRGTATPKDRQRPGCRPAAAPLGAAARTPPGCVARSLHTAAVAAGMLVARALPAGLGASSKMYTLFPDGPLASCRTPKSTVDHSFGCGWAAAENYFHDDGTIRGKEAGTTPISSGSVPASSPSTCAHIPLGPSARTAFVRALFTQG